ncbi:MAG: hypothetical protein JSU70_05745, partial [Phycisphaerales bacterium]
MSIVMNEVALSKHVDVPPGSEKWAVNASGSSAMSGVEVIKPAPADGRALYVTLVFIDVVGDNQVWLAEDESLLLGKFGFQVGGATSIEFRPSYAIKLADGADLTVSCKTG